MRQFGSIRIKEYIEKNGISKATVLIEYTKPVWEIILEK